MSRHRQVIDGLPFSAPIAASRAHAEKDTRGLVITCCDCGLAHKFKFFLFPRRKARFNMVMWVDEEVTARKRRGRKFRGLVVPEGGQLAKRKAIRAKARDDTGAKQG